ncbi:hypothetical protein [Streptomyces murinus]|uniref:hypothetical protein n=1 Tax=Streptomyces murinus TaxID=33900 RepID=UPI003F45A0C3
MTEDSSTQVLQEELRSLERRAQAVRRGQGRSWTRNVAVQASGLSKQTVSGWFSQTHPRIPKNQDDLWKLVSTYSSWANERARRPYWEKLLENANISTRADTPSKALGQRVRDWTDPFALEVHRSISARGRKFTPSSLPAYVRRPHDDQLEGIALEATNGASRISILLGESSTGKTRACWEVVQRIPDSWNLWHPISPSHAEALALALDKGIPPRTVLWLNETQLYLDTPASSLGERVAAGLRELLRDTKAGPILILGTMWPTHWDRITRYPAAGGDDRHPQARSLLAGSETLVPGSFFGEPLEDLKKLMRSDPRLAEAYKSTRGKKARITQFLAGAPAQMERYLNAPQGARAIMDAAIDLRRFGHAPIIRESLLVEISSAAMDPEELILLGDSWIRESFEYALTPCKGVSGPLNRVPLTLDTSAPYRQYRVSDYVEQAGSVKRASLLPPQEFPYIVLRNVSELEQLRAIASSLVARGRIFHAAQLYLRASELGDYESGCELADILDFANDHTGAVEVARRHYDAGDPGSARKLVGYLYQNGQIEEVEEVCVREINRGDAKPLVALKDICDDCGDSVTLQYIEGKALSRNFPDLYYRIFESGDLNSNYVQFAREVSHRLQVSQEEAEGLINAEFEVIAPRLHLINDAMEEKVHELRSATERLQRLVEEDSSSFFHAETIRIRQRIEDLQKSENFTDARNLIDNGLNCGRIGLEVLDVLLFESDPSHLEESASRFGLNWEGGLIGPWALADVRHAYHLALGDDE